MTVKKKAKKPRKLSDTQLGDLREEMWRDKRIAEGWLSFKRNRLKFKPIDLWENFDVCSMNGTTIELTQVKGHDARHEQKQMKIWLAKNHDKIPPNVRCIVAYHRPELPEVWKVVVIREAVGGE